MNVKRNAGKTILKILQRHFPIRHPMQKMFNGISVKITKDFLVAIAAFKMNALWSINVSHPILCTRQRSLIKATMNVKDILMLLKHQSKTDSGMILETSKIKGMRSALNFQSISGL